MKKVTFPYIHLDNFGRFTEPIDVKLGHRTLISGQNGVGKSTVKRMIMYILGTKDENGKEISGIRPHDENGVDIDGLTTVAELTVSVDGAENTMKRTCFQEKNRQGEYTGKDNLQYFVDDVKKGTKKAYEEFVSGFIPDMACISAQEVLGKDTAGRIIKLSIFSKHTDDDIINENPDFEPIRGKLRANTVADLKKSCRDKIKEKTKQRDAYPARIDEVEKQKVDIDLEELELLKNDLNEQIAENKEKQENVDKQFEKYDGQTKDILDLHFELNGLQQKANLDLEKKRSEIMGRINTLDNELKAISRHSYSLMQDIKDWKEDIEKNTILINATRENWTTANERVFGENSLICSYCGQEYPVEKKEQLRAEFESHKAEELADLTKRGNGLKDLIDKRKKDIELWEKALKEYEDKESKMRKQIDKLEKQLDELPQSIDISDREDVKQLKQQIAEKEAAMQKGNSASEIRQQLQDEREELQRQKAEVQRQLDKAEENNRIDERVAELKKQQLVLSQEIADVEKELDLIKSFERRKAELLESDVNSHFSIIQWRMFKEMQNGELADICSPYVGGTSYDGNLNKGARILVQLDICLSFQNLYDVQMPVLLDDGESVDSWRIPQVENQLIIFKRTDDKELKIECLEG